jgi:site-specific DNA recombinase
MDPTTRIALYARVSSQRQADEATIESQVAALKQQITADQGVLDPELLFRDEGYSGATLQRPALERLRDLAHVGAIDRLYVHSPDRLARNFVLQILLLDEFSKRGVRVLFLNQPPADSSPAGQLLLHMQGLFAEYERAQILERTRRGRRFKARQGQVSVLAHAPYGYRYVPKHDGNGQARYERIPEEAAVVARLFRWVALEGVTLSQARQRLADAQVPTRTGRPRWDCATLRGILRNPAYHGQAHWGKSRLQERTAIRRPKRGQPERPRQAKVARPVPESEHEIIAVPAVIDKELFDSAAQRLEDNRRRQRTRQAGASYLLSGLLVCGRCGSAYCGRQYRKGLRRYVYYRCLGTDKYRNGGSVLCANTATGADVEGAVWTDLCSFIRDPARLEQELRRRQGARTSHPGPRAEQQGTIAGLKRQASRVADMYQAGHLEKSEFEARMARVKQALAREEQAHAQCARAEQQAADEQALLNNFERFAQQLELSLESLDSAAKRTLLNLLIKRIEVGDNDITIVYKVQPHASTLPSTTENGLQHRLKFGPSPSG